MILLLVVVTEVSLTSTFNVLTVLKHGVLLLRLSDCKVKEIEEDDLRKGNIVVTGDELKLEEVKRKTSDHAGNNKTRKDKHEFVR